MIAAGASDSVAATFSEGSEEVERDPDYAGPAEFDKRFDSQGIIWTWSNSDKKLTSVITHISDEENFYYGGNQKESTEAERFLGRFLYSQVVSDSHSLSLGISLEDIDYLIDFNAKIVACNDFDPECSTIDAEYIDYNDKLSVLTYEFYLEDRWSISDKSAITFGLNHRDDDYIEEGRLEPRIRWDYSIRDDLAIYASAGQYSQLPKLREMIDVLGNPKLDTVKADHYVFGFNYEFGNGWQWKTDIYYKNLDDIVISSEQDEAADNYSNNADGKAYGIEFLVKKDFSDRWYGWASLSLSETDRTNKVTDKTVKFEYDRPILFNIVANHQLTPHWMLGIKWTLQSGGRYTPVTELKPSSNFPDRFEPIYGELNSETYPNFHKLDFRAEYMKPKSWGHWKFYIDILNVYNRENIEEYEYAPDGQDLVSPPSGFGQVVPVKEETGDGLIPSLGFEVRF